AKISDIGERLSNTGTRIKAAFGAALLPVFEPLFNWIIKIGSGFARWLEMFPNITRWLGYIGIFLAALAGLASLVALAAGVKL
ncbi:phage tail tape measure protein, partial [Escherichia coli]|nr:phage tail tape measure protein [Escherichia coli]